MAKVLCDFVDKPLTRSHYHVEFGAHKYCGDEDIFFIFYAKSRYDLSKESFDFVVDGRLSKITFMSSTSWSIFLNSSLDLT